MREEGAPHDIHSVGRHIDAVDVDEEHNVVVKTKETTNDIGADDQVRTKSDDIRFRIYRGTNTVMSFW